MGACANGKQIRIRVCVRSRAHFQRTIGAWPRAICPAAGVSLMGTSLAGNATTCAAVVNLCLSHSRPAGDSAAGETERQQTSGVARRPHTAAAGARDVLSQPSPTAAFTSRSLAFPVPPSSSPYVYEFLYPVSFCGLFSLPSPPPSFSEPGWAGAAAVPVRLSMRSVAFSGR